MVLEINETVFGTETCKSGEAAGEQTDPKVDMQIANHPCRILPLLYYCCDRQHCVQGVSYQTGICNLGWCRDGLHSHYDVGTRLAGLGRQAQQMFCYVQN